MKKKKGEEGKKEKDRNKNKKKETGKGTTTTTTTATTTSSNNRRRRLSRYSEWKCNKCNLILRARNEIKLARLVKVHIEFHDSASSTTSSTAES